MHLVVAAVPAVCCALTATGWLRAHHRTRVLRSGLGQDALTRLPDRTRLREALEAFVAQRPEGERRTLVVIDLIGFKRYNELFGYAAGDALLRRLSDRLCAAVGDGGQVYRLRGAGFAILAPGTRTVGLRAAAATALEVSGEGFAIRCVHAAVVVPDAARDVSEALKLADQSIQAERTLVSSAGAEFTSGPPGAGAARVAISAYDVAEMAAAVGHCMGLTGTELDDLERAAALRDVGMMALPSELVEARGALTDEEWRFVHLHPLIGERLLRANFGMDGVAAVVRSSHERWDGRGYPDGLAGEEIPLGARIAFVCSAFQDMTSARPHRQALAPERALDELQRCAGTQFDPAVVSAFVVTISDRAVAPAAAAR